MKHWAQFLYDGGRWAKMLAGDMERLYARKDDLLRSLEYINLEIEKEEKRLTDSVLQEWTEEEINEAKDLADKANEV
ncbi:MAG: hypothetical protein ABJG41_09855 [Cyclobacteriaceae bacterium]